MQFSRARLLLPLLNQRPTAQNHRLRAKKRDDLLIGDGERRLCPLSAEFRFAAQLIKRGGPGKSKGFAEGMSCGARCRDRRFRMGDTLVRKTKMP